MFVENNKLVVCGFHSNYYSVWNMIEDYILFRWNCGGLKRPHFFSFYNNLYDYYGCGFVAVGGHKWPYKTEGFRAAPVIGATSRDVDDPCEKAKVSVLGERQGCETACRPKLSDSRAVGGIRQVLAVDSPGERDKLRGLERELHRGGHGLGSNACRAISRISQCCRAEAR
jgi:hypothetical protein